MPLLTLSLWRPKTYQYLKEHYFGQSELQLVGCQGQCLSLPSCLCFILSISLFFLGAMDTETQPPNQSACQEELSVISTRETHFVNIAAGLQVTSQSDMINNDIIQQIYYSNWHKSLSSLNSQPFQDIGSLAKGLLHHSAAVPIRLIPCGCFQPALL